MTSRSRLLCFAAMTALSTLACKKVLGLSGEPGAYEAQDGAVPVDPEKKDAHIAIELPPDSDASCTADRLSDPQNCGSCGHDCRNGACQSGRCQPTTVVTVKDTNLTFAVRQGDVYAPEKDTIVRSGNGTTKFTVVQSGVGSFPSVIVLSDSMVAWASYSNGFLACPTKGCTAGSHVSNVGKPALGAGVLPGSTSAYPFVWLADSRLQTYSGLNGPTTFADGGAGEAQCTNFTANDTFAFFSDMLNAQIHTIKHGAGNTAAIVKSTPANYPCGIAARGSHLFWADLQSIWRADIEADGSLSRATALAKEATMPGTIDADDTYVYWASTASDAAAILRCPIDKGCTTPETFVRLEYPTRHIAVDGPYLYFSATINGTVGTEIDRVAR